MNNRPFKILLFLVLFLFGSGAEGAEPFKISELKLNGRLRHLRLESLFPGEGKSVVILERMGAYPYWRTHLSIWRVTRGEPFRDAEIQLPTDSLFYGFVRFEEEPLLILVRSSEIEIWSRKNGTWSAEQKRRARNDSPFSVPELGDVTPFETSMEELSTPKEAALFIPGSQGIMRWKLTSSKLERGGSISVPPRAFYYSGESQRPLDLPFWVRGTLWYPQFFTGSFDGKGKTHLLLPWMDEVTLVPLSGGEPTTHLFRRFTEDERDDSQGYAVTVPTDLNHDGRTDFVVNKFKGSTTSMTADTKLYLTNPQGEISDKGISLKSEGNRAGGAIVVDLNRDGFTDLIVASSQFNAWAVVRAVIRKRAEVQFSFYLGKPTGIRAEEPDLSRELAYRFNLSDAELDGILPALGGDFNGDGFPDVAYSADRKGISIMLQEKGAKDFFHEYPNVTVPLTVPRSMAVDDLNGDKKSDIVLYDYRSSGNRSVFFLMNQGKL